MEKQFLCASIPKGTTLNSARGEVCASLSSEWGSGQALEVISMPLQLKLGFSGPTSCPFAPPRWHTGLVSIHVKGAVWPSLYHLMTQRENEGFDWKE